MASLVADTGGALGLFLGFSFYMLWYIILALSAALKGISTSIHQK